MSTYSCNISGARFEAICNYWEDSYAWGHRVELYEDGRPVAFKRVRYYNRTWEAYPYQNAILCAIDKLLFSAKAKCLADFKSERGYKRLTAERRKEFDAYMIHCDELQKYLQLYSHYKQRI